MKGTGGQLNTRHEQEEVKEKEESERQRVGNGGVEHWLRLTRYRTPAF